ncbi:MAG: Ig-like domain-containing protein [Janthinobacterium lividum]
MSTTSSSDQTIYGTAKANLLVGGSGNDHIYGAAGNDTISAGAGDDYVDGGDGDDYIDGGSGNDTLLGGAGNDILHGGTGDDTLDGGTGFDALYGDDGNDTLIYRYADHGPASAACVHPVATIDGGCGTDTLKLVFTRDEWLRSDVQADVARYVAFLAAEPNQIYNLGNRLLGSSDFNGTFSFNAFDLNVSRVEKFVVVVDGLAIDPRDEAVTARADAITTDEDHAAAAFNLLANDSVPDLVRGVTVGTAAHGTVTLTQNYTDPANPVASVVYTPNATYYQYLAAGEKAFDTFTYTVTDADGDTSTATATVTITGVNDGPAIVGGTTTAAVVEDSAATLSGKGAITFSDVDLTDSHTVAVGAARVVVSGNAPAGFAPPGGFGTLTAAVSENTTDQNNQGTINWSFAADNATVQKLAVGQTATQTYTLTLTDKAGATTTQDVTVTITGAEDAPTITTATATGTVTEDATTSTAGNIAFADADIIDTHSVSVAPAAAGYLGTFTSTIDKAATGTGSGNVHWTFAVDNALIQNLAQGETLTQKYTVTVADNHGGTVAQVVTVTIVGTNDTPVAVADVGPATTEDGAVVTGSVATNDSDVDHGAVLSYALNAPVAGLTIAKNGSYSFDPSNAAYQALAQGETQTIIAAYTVTDDHGATATSTLTITVTGTNDVPVAVADTAAVNEDSIVTGTVAANDSDVDHGAVLSFALNAPIAGLTLNKDGSYSFDASNAAYQALAQGETQAVVASYTVTDDHGAKASSTLTITVTGTNDAPIAIADTAAATEDGAIVTGNVGANDTDVDHGATRSFALNAPVAGLTLKADGSYSFDPSNAAYQALAQGETQSVVASYTVTDDHGAKATSTLTITVTGTNDAPVAIADVATAIEDGAIVTGNVGANDTDIDHGATRTFALNAPVAGLTIAKDGSYSFDPANAAYQALAQGETQTVVASYTVTDDHGATSTSTLTITVTGTNDAPVAVADTASTVEDQPAITGNVGANDTDVDHGATRTFSLDAPVAGLTLKADGSYSFDPSNAVYQPLAKGETQVVVAHYTVTDDHGATAQSTLTITVAGTNDAPVAMVDTATATEDAPAVTGSVAANDYDVDHGAVLTFSLPTPVAGLTLAADGHYSFDAGNAAHQALAQGETQTVVATYAVTDEQGTTSYSALIVTVTGTNDAPVAVVDTAATTEDAPAITGSVATNDFDVDHGAVLSYALAAPVAGLTLDNHGGYSFDPSNTAYQALAQGETQNVVATYTVTDEHGATATSTLTIAVTGTNDAPVAVADTAAAAEDATVAGSVAANDHDVDHGAILSYALAAPVAGLTLNADGSYSFDASAAAYQPLAQGESQVVTATYIVTDEHGATATSTLAVTVAGTNDAPVAAADFAAATEDGAVLSGSVATNDHDVDHGAVLSYALAAPVAGLTVGTDGSYHFDPSNAAYQALAQGETQVVTASYTVTDEHGSTAASTLAITVTGTNDAPVATADTDAVLEDKTVTGSVATNDHDVDHGAVLHYTLDAPVAGLTLNTDGSYSFDASNAAYQALPAGTTPVVAHYTVTDEFGATAQSTLTIGVTAVNDAPTIGQPMGALAPVASATTTASTGVIHVAVVDSYVGEAAQIIAQLADSKAYTFDIHEVQASSIASSADLAGYNVVVEATAYYENPGNTYWTSLADYAATGMGGVMTFGLEGYKMTSVFGIGSIATTALDSVTPLASGGAGAYGIPYSYNNGDLSYDTSHPVTAGVPTASGFLYAGAVLDAAATALNTFAAPYYYYGNGYAASVETTGSGVHLVNLGGLYGIAINDATNDTTGAFDQLLEQGVAYAGGGGTPPGLTTLEDHSLAITGLSFADVDASGAMETVTLSVAHGTLTLPTTDGLTVSGDGHALVLTGTLAAINAAVATIGYQPDADYNGQDTLSVDVNDNGNSGIGGALTAHADYGITVISVNDAPVAAPDVANTTEDAPIVTGSVATNDHDVDTPAAALHYTLDAPIAGLTINADGSYGFDPSDAAYQPLAAGQVQTVVANYTVTDDHGATGHSTLTLGVTGIDDAPVAVADTAATDEDHAIDIAAKANDYDPDTGDTTTISAVSATSANGAAVSLNADGTIHYDPNAAPALQALRLGETATDTFTYTLKDAAGATATGTVSVTVDGRTEAPVAHADVVTTGEHIAVSGSVIANDSYTGSFSAVPNILVNGSFEDPHLADPNSYTVGPQTGWTSADPSGFEIWGTGFLGNTASDGTQFVELDNAGYQDAYSQDLTTEVGRRYDLSFDLAVRNGTDPSTNAVEFLVNGVSLGIITPQSTDFTTYTMTFYGTGHDTITFREPAYANDGVGGLIDNLRVLSPNDAAISAVDGDATLVGATVAGSHGGSFVVHADGSYTFDPGTAFDHLQAGQSDTSSVEYTLTDSGGSSTATVTVTVNGANDAPVATPDLFITPQATIVTGIIAASDVDDGSVLGYTLDAPVAGLTLNADGSFGYDPGAASKALAAGEQQDVVAHYTVTDEHGATAQSTLTITVVGTNDAPTAVADTAAATQGAVVTGSVATNDGDVDHGAVLGYTLDAPVAGLTLAADGSYSFEASDASYRSLAQDEKGVVVAHYTVTDEHGATGSSTLTIGVTGVNDAPVAMADVAAVKEDAVVTGSVATNDGDVDHGAILTYALQAPVAGLTLNADGSYSFDASNAAYQSLAEGVTKQVAATYTVTDEHGAAATATLTIAVTGVNDAPVAGADTAAALSGVATTVAVLANDHDVDAGSTLSVVSATAGAHGTTAVNADGTVTYTSAAGYGGSDSFTYVVTDGMAKTTGTVTVAVDRPPVATDDTLTVITGTTSKLAVLANDTDADGDKLTVTSASGATHGTVTINADSTVNYLPTAGYEGADSFKYTVSDGHGGTSSANVALIVSEKAVAPTLIVGSSTTIAPTDGAAIKTSLALHAGDIVTFQWNFTTDDYAPYKDFAFATVNGSVYSLSNTQATGDYGASGWQTFTYTANTDGTYVFGQGVMNDKDTSVNSYLGVDKMTVNGVVVQGFENGLGTTATLGTASVVTSGHNTHTPVTTITPTEGTHEAFLTSTPSTEAQIESFLGLTSGRLVNVTQSEGPEYTPIVVPVGVKVATTAHPDSTFATISGAPVGSVFNHGTYDAVHNTWQVAAADLGGNLTVTAPSDYAGSFTLSVTATSVVNATATSATSTAQTQVVTVDAAAVNITAPAGGGTLAGGTLADVLHSGAGNDTLTGNGGADTFDFSSGAFGKDIVTDFTAGTDFLQFSKSAFANPADALGHATQVGANVLVTLDANDTVLLSNVTLANLHTTDFHIVG